MWGKIKRRLGKWGTAGVGTVIVSIVIGIAPEILPYTGYPISQNAARGLFWASIGAGIFGIALIIYALAWNRQSQTETIARESEYDHNAHMAKLITDDKAESLLMLPTALQDLGELAIELADKLAESGISQTKLKEIQTRLQADYKIKQLGMYEDVPEQTIRNAVKQTIKRLRISGLNEKTITLMLHIAGVLDDEEAGIMTQWQKSDRYKSVVRLQTKIATQELNNAVYVYLCYSIGINSVLLLVSYFPAKARRKVLRTFRKTPAELREDRIRILNVLLTDIRQLVEKALDR